MSGFAELSQLLNGGLGNFAHGQMSAQELGELVKALAVGADRDPPASFGAGDGFAFRTEDLDGLMRVSTFGAKAIVLWKMLVKSAAKNTVVEWNETESYGQDGFDGFIADGSAPEQMDSVVSRQFGYVKYLGVQGGITHGSTLIAGANGDMMAGEQERKTMKLLELVERNLFYGDSALDPLQWDGYFTQMINAIAAGRTAQVIDKRGAPLGIEDVEAAAAAGGSEPNYATLTDIFCNPLVKSDMNASAFPANRGVQGQTSPSGKLGGSFQSVETSIGDVVLRPDSFISFGRRASASGLGDAVRRPPTPISAVALSAASADSAAFLLGSEIGDYTYSVVARNRFGCSPPLSMGSVTIAATGRRVTFSVQASPGNPTAYFEIYRSTRNGGASTEQLIARVVNPSQGYTTVAVVDQNLSLPGTSMALAIEWSPEVIDFKQLAPMMKVMFGQQDLTYRWAQVLYGVPRLMLPKKAFLFRNIGRRALAA